MLFGTLLPFLIEFLCSKTTDAQKEINLNFSTNENKVLLSGVEEENKILEQEYKNIDNELNKKKAELSAKNFLTEKEKAEIEKKNAIFLR